MMSHPHIRDESFAKVPFGNCMQIAWQFILDNECKIMRSEFGRITHEVNDMKLSIKGNADKGMSATTLPFSAIILPFSATTGLISSTLNGNP